MGINKTVDTVIVRKVLEMRSAGQKKTKIGEFFCHTRQWADYVLLNYSSETFRALFANKRGVKRKTSTEEDEIDGVETVLILCRSETENSFLGQRLNRA